MLAKAKTMNGYHLNGLDGEMGTVKDFLFDDRHWAIRYLVANSGNWLTGRKVLISPYALREVGDYQENISVNLTKKQIEDSPSLETDRPVSQQFEESYYGYYGWPTYWGGSSLWGGDPTIVRDPSMWKYVAQNEENWDRHLRSMHDVDGHNIQATDGEIGHVEDFLIDVETWAIRYLIVDTKNWWPGKKVLIAPQWIERVSWSEQKVFVNLTREAIKSSAEYEDATYPTRDYEASLYDHYGRNGYWNRGQGITTF